MNTRTPSSFARRGFTLIELMVVLSASLFFSISVFMMTRDATRFFQREARLADATMASASGFRRLANDVARAGFLTSPNLAKDPRRCPTPALANAVGSAPTSAGYASFPLLQKLGLLNITVGGSLSALSGDFAAVLTNNGLSPDRIILYGNYTSNETFPTQGYTVAGGTTTFTLTLSSGALFRSGYYQSGLTTAQRQTILNTIFPTGRILRISTQIGEEQYAIIDTVTAPAAIGTAPTLVTKTTGPALQLKAANGVCGIRGLQDGITINTVNVIQYNLRDVSNATNYPTLAFLFTGQARHPRDVATRLDLVRSELDPATGDDIAGSVEVVAENVVDLKFGADVVSAKNPTYTLTNLAPGNAAIPTYAGDPTTGAAAAINAGPHLIRGIRVRMSTRASAPDREASSFGTNVGTGLYRVGLSWTGGTLSDFARVRTLETTVATRNSRYELW